MLTRPVTGAARRALIAFGLAGLFGAATGCVALVPYVANTERFKEQKVEDLKKSFAEVVTRSTDPRFTSAELTEEYIKAEGQQAVVGAWYTTSFIPFVNQVYFNNLTKIEVYENNKVWVYDTSGRVAFQTQFASRDDCFLLVDIIETARARKSAAK